MRFRMRQVTDEAVTSLIECSAEQSGKGGVVHFITAKGAQDSFIVVTKWGGPATSKWPALAALPGGNFHLTFFDRAFSATQPDYEVSMHYYDNGVADNLAMNFGDFTMDGTIASFKLLPGNC